MSARGFTTDYGWISFIDTYINKYPKVLYTPFNISTVPSDIPYTTYNVNKKRN
jgi:hypothetical protein